MQAPKLSGFLQNLPLIFFLGVFSLLVLWLFPLPFFWDNILLSSQLADYYYANGFSQYLLPDSLDTGHPPFWGMYVALGWLVFGKQLWVGHALMLPFVLGVVWQVYRLVKHFLPGNFHFLGMALVLADPTWLAQSVQVSSDVAMLFFVLLGIAAVVNDQPKWLAVAAVGCLLLSLRGLVYAGQLGLLAIVWPWVLHRQFRFWRVVIVFLPAVLVTLCMYGYHWYAKGWIRYHPDSNWLTEAELAGSFQFMKNLVISVWRVLDFGRIGIWLVMGLVVILKWRLLIQQPVIWLVLCQWPLILIVSVSPEYMGHRYLMGLYLMGALALLVLLQQLNWNANAKNGLVALLLTCLLLGHFIPYPGHVAVGWDATLAHVPYHRLKENMLQYMHEAGIKASETGSDFPNDAAIGFADLSGRTDVFPPKDLNVQPYILYSNVYNGFSDEEINTLKTTWKVLKTESSGRIEMTLYARP